MIKQPVRTTLPWLALLSVLAAACALETALASLPPAVAPSSTDSLISTSRRGERASLTIMLRDPDSGIQTAWQCMSDQPLMEDLVVDAHALANVAEALCGP